MLNVVEIVEAYLKEQGLKGLANESGCHCEIPTLMYCGNLDKEDCQACKGEED